MRLPRVPLIPALFVYGAAVAVVLWLTLSPTDKLPPVTLWDKAEHVIAFGLLAGLGLWLFPRHRPRLTVFVLVLGVVIEILQSVMGLGRQGDWRDAVADTLGVLAALAVLGLVSRRPRR